MLHEQFSRDYFTASSGQICTAGGRRYELAGKIGDGAIGVVRRAIDCETKKPVAIKFLSPELKYIEESSFGDIFSRFQREGKRGQELIHDHLVRVLAYEENQSASSFVNGNGPANPFIVMEYIQGTTLEHFIKGQQSGPGFNITRKTLYIAHCIASALRYLHQRGIVHRDVKPANIFFTRTFADALPSVVKLGDFGVVKWGDFRATMTTGTLTMTGQVGLGTAKYMSPEQALNSKEVDVRADMYAFGITLFELFTNQILPNSHHVYRITMQRSQRGNVISRLYELGLGMVPFEYQDLFTSIYDMFAVSPDVRPSSRMIEGKLAHLLEKQTSRISDEQDL